MAAVDGRAAKRRKLNLTENVDVLVGEDEDRFTPHKDALCSHSKSFRAALDGSFKEARDRIIRLPDVEPESFRAYSQWTYGGDIVLSDPEEAITDAGGHQQLLALVKLYIVGDQFNDALFRNHVMDKIIALYNTTKQIGGTTTIKLAFSRLPEGSKLRKFIVNRFKNHPSKWKWLQQHRSDLPFDFFADTAIGFGRRLDDQVKTHDRNSIRNCRYHDHDDEVPACTMP